MKICLLGDARSIHIAQLTRELVRAGHDVHIVTRKSGEVPGASVQPLRVPPAGLSNLRGYERRLEKLFDDLVSDFDVVSVQFLADWPLGERHFERGAIAVTPWGSDVVDPPGETPPSARIVEMRRAMIRRAAAVSAFGPTFATVVERFADLPAGSVRTTPFGVDCAQFDPARFDAGTRGAPVVGFFKGFRAVYGPDVLMDAVPKILARHSRATFELVGDGALLESCHEAVRRGGLEGSVRFLPRYVHADLPERLARWDMCVVPSRAEAFGVAALEASAMALPVVASNVCGLRDTVCDGETGVLVRPGDAEDLARAVADLLDDPSTARRMGTAGRARVQKGASWTVCAARWIEFFEEVRSRSCVCA